MTQKHLSQLGFNAKTISVVCFIAMGASHAGNLNAKTPSRQDAKEEAILFPGLNSDHVEIPSGLYPADHQANGTTDGWTIVGGSGINRQSTVFYIGNNPETAMLPESFKHFLDNPNTTVVFPEGSKQ